MIDRSSWDAALAAYAEAIDRAVGRAGFAERGPIRAYRAIAPTPPETGLLAPVICAVAQGTKEVVLGRERYVYAAGQFLLSSTLVPAMGRTLRASPKAPCLWLSIRIDPAVVVAALEALPPTKALPDQPLRSVEASAMDLAVLRALLKIAWLLEGHDADDYLIGLAMRELVYRLLATSQAARVRQIVAEGGGSSQVLDAVRWLREHFGEPLSVDRLARQHHMSPSVFYLRFKQVTAMSPLQFQKQLRLQEAKRLIASTGLNAAEAAARVGYDSPSHFNRDYRRFFGDSPRRHVAKLREDSRASDHVTAH